MCEIFHMPYGLCDEMMRICLGITNCIHVPGFGRKYVNAFGLVKWNNEVLPKPHWQAQSLSVGTQ